MLSSRESSAPSSSKFSILSNWPAIALNKTPLPSSGLSGWSRSAALINTFAKVSVLVNKNKLKITAKTIPTFCTLCFCLILEISSTLENIPSPLSDAEMFPLISRKKLFLALLLASLSLFCFVISKTWKKSKKLTFSLVPSIVNS